MLRWFPRLQVATTCFSCSPPDLNLVATNFMFCIHVKQPLPLGDNPIAVNKYYYYYYYYYKQYRSHKTSILAQTACWLEERFESRPGYRICPSSSDFPQCLQPNAEIIGLSESTRRQLCSISALVHLQVVVVVVKEYAKQGRHAAGKLNWKLLISTSLPLFHA